MYRYWEQAAIHFSDGIVELTLPCPQFDDCPFHDTIAKNVTPAGNAKFTNRAYLTIIWYSYFYFHPYLGVTCLVAIAFLSILSVSILLLFSFFFFFVACKAGCQTDHAVKIFFNTFVIHLCSKQGKVYAVTYISLFPYLRAQRRASIPISLTNIFTRR